MNFPYIERIGDLESAVAGKKEIKFQQHPNGCTVGCYVFCDSKTFDTPEARECRGIAFDSRGDICSRPLHKFFNIGERSDTQLRDLVDRDDLVGKLCHVIDWSWWWVSAPFWGPAAFSVLVFLGMVIVAAVTET